MQETTLAIQKAALDADPTLTPDERQRLMTTLRNVGRTKDEPAPPRIMRRAEAAKVLCRSVRGVDLLTDQGILRKVMFPGRVRAAGYRAADVYALVNGNG